MKGTSAKQKNAKVKVGKQKVQLVLKEKVKCVRG